MAAEEEGGTVLDHLQAYERHTGTVHPMLADAPVLPDGCEPLWNTFAELHACRGNYGFGPCRITYADIDAFQRVTDVTLRPWELAAVRKADAAYLERIAERKANVD